MSRPFWLGQTEVTQEQFELIMGKNPSSRKQPDLPVEVSWNDAQAFCKKLNETQKTPPGYEWRLPTEAEWEYACRAGSGGPFCGSKPSQLPAQEDSYGKYLGQFGWFALNSGGQTHPVGRKKPNAFGLHDMHGNVWEWCLDAVKRNKTSFMSDRKTGTIDPFSQEGEWRALRGGNFEVPHSRCRSAYRGANAPTVTNSDRGFVGPCTRFGSRRKLHRYKRGQGQKNRKPLPDLKTHSRRKLSNGKPKLAHRAQSHYRLIRGQAHHRVKRREACLD